MNNTLSAATLLLIVFTFLVVPGGCQSDTHSMASSKSDMTTVCKERYDSVVGAHRAHPNPGTNYNEVISTSQCPCCKTEISVCCENGTMMVKCGKFARNDVAFDKCMPPTGMEN